MLESTVPTSHAEGRCLERHTSCRLCRIGLSMANFFDGIQADAAFKPEVVMLPDDLPEARLTATLDSGCEDNWITWSKMSEELGLTGAS